MKVRGAWKALWDSEPEGLTGSVTRAQESKVHSLGGGRLETQAVDRKWLQVWVRESARGQGG